MWSEVDVDRNGYGGTLTPERTEVLGVTSEHGEALATLPSDTIGRQVHDLCLARAGGSRSPGSRDPRRRRSRW